MRGCHCIVEGQVQGVGFRYFTQRAAEQLGIRGWVRNLPGGAVEIRAEGDHESLQQFLETVRQGPSFSRVAAVKTSPSELGGYSRFEIRI